jgi:DNA polymerase-1
MTTLLLVDGSSYLYRAFHALPDLRNRAGEPTGAIFGVTNMLRKLVAEYKPDLMACVFDAPGPTFRDDWYPEYKATRSPMPPELRSQIEPLHEVIRAMGLCLISEPGVEADDVIGTLARQADLKGIRTLISTGDKDMVQLITPQITLMNTMSNESLNEDSATEKYGLPPRLFVDYLTLIGDTIDNVRGVAKVGPKTALKWITQFGSLDGVMAAAPQMPGAVGENLRQALDWLPTAKKLLTIEQNLPLPYGVDSLHRHAPDEEALNALFDRYELRSLRKPVVTQISPPIPSRPIESAAPVPLSGHDAEAMYRAHDYQTVLDDQALEECLQLIQNAAITALDSETTALDPFEAQLVGISLSVETGRAFYIPVAHDYPGAPTQLSRDHVLQRLLPWLESQDHKKVGQHLKYDQHVFLNHGIRLQGITEDTLLQSYVLESHLSHNMDALARRHLGAQTIPFEAVAGKGAHQISFNQVDLERATAYAAEDADITRQLYEHFSREWPHYPRLETLYREIELPVAQVLFEMERNGVAIDSGLLELQSTELGKKMLEAEKRAHECAKRPFNLGSTKQLQEILFVEQGLPVNKKTPGGAPSTDEDVLQELALDHPLPKWILEYRSLQKLKSTYTDKLPRMVNPRTGRVHTHYAQAVAVTGRLSSSDPNLQNIPVRTAEGRRIREAFIAPPGRKIVSADYSQIELRIMAHLSSDPGLMSAFSHGEDVHRRTASEIFNVPLDAVDSEQRRVAKTINFGLIYGMSAFGLAQNLNIDRTSAKTYIDRYFARYPGVADYMERTRSEARTKGYVETLFGRRLHLTDINSGSPGRRQAAERAAINAPMQGTAADLIKLAMIAVSAWLKKEQLQSLLIMQVHDELVLEVIEEELDHIQQHLPRLMCDVTALQVPLIVDVGVGQHWDAAH